MQAPGCQGGEKLADPSTQHALARFVGYHPSADREPDHPDQVITGAEHIHGVFVTERHARIDEHIAHQFGPGHTQRADPIPLPPRPQLQRKDESVGIEVNRLSGERWTHGNRNIPCESDRTVRR